MSVFCILPMVITTSVFYFRENYINWNIGLKCALGGIIGGAIGCKVLGIIPDKYLKIAFIIFLTYASISMIKM